MNNSLFRLELLPNELLLDLFRYFDARDLFRTFNNINHRFNALIRSPNHLSVTFSKSDSNDINDSHIFSDYIHTMILSYEANINLNNFPNLRRLKFLNPSCEQLDRLCSITLSSLEHLSVGYASDCSPRLDRCKSHDPSAKVFSGGFPSLTSCYLFWLNIISTLLYATQSIQLRILRVGSITLMSYQAILSACPNLYSLRFMYPFLNQELPIMRPHLNLKRMVIDLEESDAPLNDYDIDNVLLCAPNLGQLRIYEEIAADDITLYLNYNWLARSIKDHLRSLHQFKYVFGIYFARKLIENDSENILNRLQESFQQKHNNRYQPKLIFKLSSAGNIDHLYR